MVHHIHGVIEERVFSILPQSTITKTKKDHKKGAGGREIQPPPRWNEA